MASKRKISNITLIGFMGTGKSSVGRRVAKILGFRFIDTDQEIEVRVGKPIARIFSDHGEEYFRKLEADVVQHLSKLENTVIATGGGLGANLKNLESLKTHSLVICLWASPKTIWERVRHNQNRPLLQVADPIEKIRSLLAERKPVYKKADVMINSELRTLPQVVQQVVYHFKLVTNSDFSKQNKIGSQN